jgi:hypothetical protein
MINRIVPKTPILPISQMIIDKYENNPKCINENKLLPYFTIHAFKPAIHLFKIYNPLKKI